MPTGRGFYAWTQEQADLLRRGRIANADLSNILEEIESLGRKEVAELRNRYTMRAASGRPARYRLAADGAAAAGREV